MRLSQFYVIGIAVRTTNQGQQSSVDIPQLWHRFFAESILDQIPNKVDACFYSVYTDYAGDFTQPYTAILGCRVSTLDNIPEGMVGKAIPGGEFVQFTAKGSLNKGAVFSEWLKIWSTKLNRKYTADFEVYGEKAQNPEDAEVGIFVAVE